MKKLLLTAICFISLASFAVQAAPKENSGADPGYAVMRCEVRQQVNGPYFSSLVGAFSPSVYLLQSGGADPVIDDEVDTCEDAIVKFIANGWRIQSIEQMPVVFTTTNSSGDTTASTSWNNTEYRFVSP